MKQLPLYKSHKVVGALAIAAIEIREDGSAIIAPQGEDYEPFETKPGFGDRFKGSEEDKGYYVRYLDGYESWSPCRAFEDGYSLIDPTEARPVFEPNQSEPETPNRSNLDFGSAIRALKNGEKVCRQGWNGKGMFLFLLPAGTIPKSAIHDPMLKKVLEDNGSDHFEALGSIRMKTADDKILTGWLASQTDMLSEDWMILD